MIPLFSYQFDKRGSFWFRLFANWYGVDFVTYVCSPSLFSERNGYRKPIIKTAKWRIFILKPIRLANRVSRIEEKSNGETATHSTIHPPSYRPRDTETSRGVRRQSRENES